MKHAPHLASLLVKSACEVARISLETELRFSEGMRIVVRALLLIAIASFCVSNAGRSQSNGCRQSFSIVSHGNLSSLAKIPTTLRFVTYNVMKLCESCSESFEDIGGRLEQIKADVIVLQEVADFATIKALAKKKLGDQFNIFFVDGQSRRKINNVVLIRRSLPYQAKLVNLRLPYGNNADELLFPRGLPIIWFKPFGDSIEPLLLVGVHLKSKVQRKAGVKTVDQRSEQIEFIREILNELELRFGVHVLIGGDFNSEMRSQQRERSMNQLLERGFANAFDISEISPLPEEQYTNVYIPREGVAQPQQIDGFLISHSLHGLVKKAGIVRSFADQARRKTTYHGILNVATDHDLVYVDVKIPKHSSN